MAILVPIVRLKIDSRNIIMATNGSTMYYHYDSNDFMAEHFVT
jgi:hypothetical protein